MKVFASVQDGREAAHVSHSHHLLTSFSSIPLISVSSVWSMYKKIILKEKVLFTLILLDRGIPGRRRTLSPQIVSTDIFFKFYMTVAVMMAEVVSV